MHLNMMSDGLITKNAVHTFMKNDDNITIDPLKHYAEDEVNLMYSNLRATNSRTGTAAH